jgi:hypothetical protein
MKRSVGPVVFLLLFVRMTVVSFNTQRLGEASKRDDRKAKPHFSTNGREDESHGKLKRQAGAHEHLHKDQSITEKEIQKLKETFENRCCQIIESLIIHKLSMTTKSDKFALTVLYQLVSVMRLIEFMFKFYNIAAEDVHLMTISSSRLRRRERLGIQKNSLPNRKTSILSNFLHPPGSGHVKWADRSRLLERHTSLCPSRSRVLFFRATHNIKSIKLDILNFMSFSSFLKFRLKFLRIYR